MHTRGKKNPPDTVKNCDQLTSFLDHDPFIINQQKVIAVLLS